VLGTTACVSGVGDRRRLRERALPVGVDRERYVVHAR